MIEKKLKVKNIINTHADIFSVTLESDERLPQIRAGQFLNVTISDKFSLKRPFGIVRHTENTLEFCFRVVGAGTTELAKIKEQDMLSVTFPLGNGFSLCENQKKIFVVGGGIGTFPLVSVLQEYGKTKEIYSFLGYQNKNSLYYLNDFKEKSKQVFVSTDDGSFGEKGFVTDLVKEQLEILKPDIVLACGPKPMFKSLKNVLSGKVPALVSVEERMGCGVGACLVCVCKLNENGEIRKKRVCKDGPVFDLAALEL